MIYEIKIRQPQNPLDINELINDDVLDSSLDCLEKDSLSDIVDKIDKIDDDKINIIDAQNLKNQNHPQMIKQQQQNPNQINDQESDLQNQISIYDEQEEKQQNLYVGSDCKMITKNEKNNIVLQKISQKQTDDF